MFLQSRNREELEQYASAALPEDCNQLVCDDLVAAVAISEYG